MARVIVVGSGIAGLVAALRAAERHEVTIVTKGTVADGSTRYAQGGIAAAVFPDDSVAAHVADTLRAGAGLTVPSVVSELASVQVTLADGCVVSWTRIVACWPLSVVLSRGWAFT